MALVTLKELIEAGVHYGHRVSQWNPKMAPYIHSKRNQIYIIDLRETTRAMLRAYRFLNRIAAQGSLILFVGTKRQARDVIAREAQRCGMPYVDERWLGGCLTNFRTIRGRLQRLEELERLLASDEIQTYSKKMRASLMRERRKIHRNLHGIRDMDRQPAALLVVDPKREHTGVAEARKLDIKVIAIVDTDCDPDLVDLPIPGNDDSMRAIEVIITKLTDAIVEGRASLTGGTLEPAAAPSQPAAEAQPIAAAAAGEPAAYPREPATEQSQQ